MFWFRRPAYGKWLAAGTLVAVAFVMDATDGATEPYPFAAVDLEAGLPITAADIRWREVPEGLLPEADLPHGARAAHDIAAGSPLGPGVVTSGDPIPGDWWAVPVGLPETVTPGTAVRLVMVNTARAVDGIVVEGGGLGTFGATEAGLVAVPGADAAAVAAAASRNELTVLVAP